MEISLASQPNLSEVFYCQIMIFWQFITRLDILLYKKEGRTPLTLLWIRHGLCD